LSFRFGFVLLPLSSFGFLYFILFLSWPQTNLALYRIWEKKYGRGANHKKKEAEEAAQERATQKAQFEARQAKREAAQASGKGRGKWNESAQVADAGWGARAPARTGAVATPAPAAAMHARPAPVRAKPDKDAGIHPSWAAKKALKEKMGVGIVPSQGKKIVFS
jgi:hypothetical protein